MLCFHVAQTGKHLLRTQNVSETFFVSQTQNLCPQQMLRARAKQENICVGNNNVCNNVSMFARAFIEQMLLLSLKQIIVEK